MDIKLPMMHIKLFFNKNIKITEIKLIVYLFFLVVFSACYNINDNLFFESGSNRRVNTSIDTIKLLVFANDPPFTQKQADGKVVGFYTQLAKNISNRSNIPIKILYLEKEKIFNTLYRDSTVVALGVYDIPIYRRDFLLSYPYASTGDTISSFYKEGITLKEYLKLHKNSQNLPILDVPICLAANKNGREVLDVVSEIMLDLKQEGKIDELKVNNFTSYNIGTEKIIMCVLLVLGFLVFLVLAYIIYKIVKKKHKHLASVDEYAILIGKIIPMGIIIVRPFENLYTKDNFYKKIRRFFISEKSIYNKKIFYSSENIRKLFDGNNPRLNELLDLYVPEKREDIINISKNVLETGEPISFYEKLKFSDGEMSENLIKMKRISLNDEYYLFVTNSNVTDLKNAQNLASENNKKMDNFLSIINHEIRTPLNTIVGFSNILNELNKEDKPSILKLILDKSKQLSSMISNILIYSKLQSNTFKIITKDVDIVEILRSRKSKFEYRFGEKEGVNIKLYLPYEAYTIRCDYTIISYIYKVLLSNAGSFTENGEILCGFKRIEDSTIIFVQDSGNGISYKDVNLVFERFSKVDNYSPGLGIGMSIAFEFTKLLPNGKIGFFSEIGKGSTFWVSFEICDDNASYPLNIFSEIELMDEKMKEGIWYEKDDNGIMVLKGGNNE